MPQWIASFATSAPVLGFLGGCISGPLTWWAATFIGGPIKQFVDLRGEVVHALKKNIRYVVADGDAIDDAALFDYAVKSTKDGKRKAGQEFELLGLRLLSLAANNRCSMKVLWHVRRVNVSMSGELLMSLAHALSDDYQSGPSREQILRALGLRA